MQNKSPTSTSGMRLSELCTYAFVFKGNSLELLTSECITPHYNHMYNRVFIKQKHLRSHKKFDLFLVVIRLMAFF